MHVNKSEGIRIKHQKSKQIRDGSQRLVRHYRTNSKAFSYYPNFSCHHTQANHALSISYEYTMSQKQFPGNTTTTQKLLFGIFLVRNCYERSICIMLENGYFPRINV